MKKFIIPTIALISLSAAIYAGLIIFADHLPDVRKKVTVYDRPASMRLADSLISEYYGETTK